MSLPNLQERRMFSLIFIGLVLLLGLRLVQRQNSFLPGLAAFICNFNNVCEYGEWEKKGNAASQPCPDCRPKAYPALAVDPFDAQIVSHGNDISWSKYKVFQFKCIGTQELSGETLGKYEDSWISNKTECDFPSTWSGDADNDGQEEITTLLSSGKGKKIALFKSGSLGSPSWQSPYFAKNTDNIGSMRIGDVDGDLLNEVVMDIGDRVWICRVELKGSSYSFKQVWTGPSYGTFIWSLNIGDADNRGDNEIILSMFGGGAPIVLKHANGTWAPQDIEKITVPSTPAIDVAKVGDVDGLPGNEIVAGGNNNKIMIWKYDGGAFKLTALSEDLGGFTQGVDAGDLDSSQPGNEIVTAAASMENQESIIYVLKCINGSLQKISELPISGTTEVVCAKDLDGDGESEIGIAIYGQGLSIYELVSADRILVKRFNCIFGYSFE